MKVSFYVFVMVLGFGSSVLAQNTDSEKDARVQFRRGIELFEEKKFEQAAIAFERAYELKPSYKILYNIAQTENELGHYAAALGFYERYLDEGHEKLKGDRRGIIIEEIKRLRTLVGTLLVKGAVDGATVYIDNRLIGELPMSVAQTVDLGEHEIVVKDGAVQIHTEIVKVAGEEDVIVTIPEVIEGDGIGTVASEDSLYSVGEKRDKRRKWTWVALGIGGASAITGTILGSVALSKRKNIEEDCENGVCPGDSLREKDTVKNLSIAADVMFGAAAAGIVTGIVLFIVEPRMGQSEEHALTVAPALSTDNAGIVFSGRF